VETVVAVEEDVVVLLSVGRGVVKEEEEVLVEDPTFRTNAGLAFLWRKTHRKEKTQMRGRGNKKGFFKNYSTEV
jgi:hypothetical protein